MTHVGEKAFLLYLESAAVLAAFVVSFLAPNIGRRVFGSLEKSLSTIARRRKLSLLLVGISALMLRAAVSIIAESPQPKYYDEFAALLASDTFASGRLTNPPHPLWKHFETLYVLSQPTYSSQYPPGRALLMAASQRLTDNPYFGVVVSFALMAAATCWMLQGWIGPEWALLGGLLTVFRWGAFSYWVNSYWGGTLSALGGALVLGSFPRIVERPRAMQAAVMAFGMALLSSTRPFEGFILCACVAMSLFWRMRDRSLRIVILPMALVLLPAAAATCYYFWRVTGNPFLVPYQLYQDQYHRIGQFVWDRPLPPKTYNSARLARYFESYLETAKQRHSLKGFLRANAIKVEWLWLFYLGPLLTVPLITVGRVLMDRRLRVLMVTGAVTSLCIFLELWLFPHYASPLFAIIILVLVEAMRHLRSLSFRGRPAGVFLTRAIPAICILMYAVPVFLAISRPGMIDSQPFMWCCTINDRSPRQDLIDRLSEIPGRHLVIVEYAPGYTGDDEWVYNAADIDASPIVWARPIESDPGDAELIRYFKDRQVWRLKLTPNKPAEAIPSS